MKMRQIIALLVENQKIERWQKFLPNFGNTLSTTCFKAKLLYKDKTIDEIELFNAFPKLDVVREIWNLTETNFAKLSRNMTMTSIATNEKFYIYPEIFHSFFPAS